MSLPMKDSSKIPSNFNGDSNSQTFSATPCRRLSVSFQRKTEEDKNALERKKKKSREISKHVTLSSLEQLQCKEMYRFRCVYKRLKEKPLTIYLIPQLFSPQQNQIPGIKQCAGKEPVHSWITHMLDVPRIYYNSARAPLQSGVSEHFHYKQRS